MLSEEEYSFLEKADIQVHIAGRPLVKADVDAGNSQENAEIYGGKQTVVSYRQLQDIADYRSAIQRWFGQIEVGGQLLIAVPHAFLFNRTLTLPCSSESAQRRIYSPASLLAEIEEALEPNTYRVRLARDMDENHDYGDTSSSKQLGDSDVVVILERIRPPAWRLKSTIASSPGSSTKTRRIDFEPPRTRVERDEPSDIHSILVLKLDHLGDLVMGLHALRQLRLNHPNAMIDLVVGSWNAKMAGELGVADRVIAFDAFPRNSSEEEVNVEATIGKFRDVVTGSYDLAIDLRVDLDTRVLLSAVRADLKAGIGRRSQFPWMDIALPLDNTRNETARAWDMRIEPRAFASGNGIERSPFVLQCKREFSPSDYAVVWGPYMHLEAGDYIFEFFIDFPDEKLETKILVDVALEYGKFATEKILIAGVSDFELPFRVNKDGTAFEARILNMEGRAPPFNFYGGRLIRKGPSNLLHQAEYASLLVELVQLRTLKMGFAKAVRV